MSEPLTDAPTASPQARQAYSYGCLFCVSGDEELIIRRLRDQRADVEAVSPSRIRIRRRANAAVEEKVPLFQGYVFFRVAEEAVDSDRLRLRVPARLLTYGDETWRLTGSDMAIAKAFFDAGGVVGLSAAYYEGDRIRIADGFLKQYEGSITRVNRRAKTAEVKVLFQDKTLTMWLGFELIERTDQAQDRPSRGVG